MSADPIEFFESSRSGVAGSVLIGVLKLGVQTRLEVADKLAKVS